MSLSEFAGWFSCTRSTIDAEMARMHTLMDTLMNPSYMENVPSCTQTLPPTEAKATPDLRPRLNKRGPATAGAAAGLWYLGHKYNHKYQGQPNTNPVTSVHVQMLLLTKHHVLVRSSLSTCLAKESPKTTDQARTNESATRPFES